MRVRVRDTYCKLKHLLLDTTRIHLDLLVVSVTTRIFAMRHSDWRVRAIGCPRT